MLFMLLKITDVRVLLPQPLVPLEHGTRLLLKQLDLLINQCPVESSVNLTTLTLLMYKMILASITRTCKEMCLWERQGIRMKITSLETQQCISSRTPAKVTVYLTVILITLTCQITATHHRMRTVKWTQHQTII